VQLLHPDSTLVQAAIDGRRDGQGASDHGAHARQEPREGLWPLLAVDNLHGGDIVVEENAGDAALGVEALLVALCGVAAAHQRALVRRDRVLVRLDAALGTVRSAVLAQRRLAVVHLVHGRGEERVPAEREVGGRHNLDEVHEVVRGLVGRLLGPVERVCVVVVRPLPPAGQLVGQLGAEAQLVDLVRHGVLLVVSQLRVEVDVEVVRVDVAAREAAPGCDVEVPDHFVHPDDALETAALLALGIDPRRVPLPLALLDVLPFPERPLPDRVGLPHLVAGVAAAWFGGVGGRRGSGAFAAVVGVEVVGALLFRVAGYRSNVSYQQ